MKRKMILFHSALFLMLCGCEKSSEVVFKEMGHLAPLRVELSSIVDEAGGGIFGMGGSKVGYIMSGEALVLVDMKKAEYKDLNESKKTVKIHLPLPKVDAPKIDMNRKKTFNFDTTKGFLSTDDTVAILSDKAFKTAQSDFMKMMESEDDSNGIIERAKIRSENIIKCWYSQLGYKATIVWEKR